MNGGEGWKRKHQSLIAIQFFEFVTHLTHRESNCNLKQKIMLTFFNINVG